MLLSLRPIHRNPHPLVRFPSKSFSFLLVITSLVNRYRLLENRSGHTHEFLHYNRIHCIESHSHLSIHGTAQIIIRTDLHVMKSEQYCYRSMKIMYMGVYFGRCEVDYSDTDACHSVSRQKQRDFSDFTR